MHAAESICIVLMSALGALSAAKSARAAPSNGPVGDRPQVSLWHAYRGDEEIALHQVVREYTRVSGAEVEVLAVPFEAYGAKLGAAVPRGHGPDVFIEAHERLGPYVRDALVAPAGDAFPAEDADRYDATSVAAVSQGGLRYGVPLASKCLALYVNDRLVPGEIADLEELLALPGLPAGAYPLAYEATSAFFHAPFLHAFGGAMVDEHDHFAFGQAASARALAFVKHLTDEHLVPEEPSGTLVVDLFASGRAAAVVSGPWLAGEIGSKVRYRVEPLPRLAAAGQPLRPYLTVEAAMLSPQGAARADARAFARWLGSTASAVIRAEKGHQVVSTLAAWQVPAVSSDALLVAFHRAAEIAIPTPSSLAMRAAWEPANRAIRKVLRGDTEPEDALHEAAARFNDATRPLPPRASVWSVLVVAGALALAGAFYLARRARAPRFRRQLAASLPAYAYSAPATLAIALLVIVPLAAGAATSLFVGTREDPRYVGLANYVAILTARGNGLLAQGSFYRTLFVTILWMTVNVVFHVVIGVTLGLFLSRPAMRLKGLYRVLLIVPWAVPSYVTALAWKGMFHKQFGSINAMLAIVGIEPRAWFARFSTAFSANVATNVWLGFPFMMVVAIAALTGVPQEVIEAAELDGASRWKRLRFVTLPMIAPTLIPAIALGAAWTFNMFNVVFLVSGGEPDGSTDILVSEAYRWAFTRDAQYGYAAAYAVLIFVVLSVLSRFLTRLRVPEGQTS
ncbi:MAG TPA: extracellular solute-binding protein [Polyangiaceae bacterium]|nr:extracellular solute-binding protein [Polyangiaceae bacterium]